MSDDSERRREGQLSRDRETIQQWADRHDAIPVRESAGTGESGRYRMVPESQVDDAHERVEWDTFFDDLDEGDHVVIYHGEEATEPFEVAGHGDVMTRIEDEDIEERLLEGETVTSTITETAVVESVVVEEITVESDLVDSEIIDDRVVDTELVGRDCTNCNLVEDTSTSRESRDLFDSDRYLETRSGEMFGSSLTGGETTTGTTGRTDTSSETMSGTGTTTDETTGTDTPMDDTTGGTTPDETTGRTETVESTTFDAEDYPYSAQLDVEETWNVTREFLERFTVESNITDTEVTEADTLEDYDIDIQGLHRSIVESGIIERDLSTEDALSRYDIESELSESDRITTHFSRERQIEEEIIDRKRLYTDVTDADLQGMEVLSTRDIDTDVQRGDAATGTAPGTGTATGTDTTPGTGTDTDTDYGESEGHAARLDEETIGKRVVDASGDDIGMVTDVDENRNRLHIDPHPGITERIKGALGWGDSDREDYDLDADQVRRVTEERVELKTRENLEGIDDRNR